MAGVADFEGVAENIDHASPASKSDDARRKTLSSWGTRGPSGFLANEVIKATESAPVLHEPAAKKSKKKGALSGVFIPTCENMWGVLIFLRFYYIVGQAGIWQTLCAVGLSFAAAFCTTAAMSSIASSGGIVSGGGPYHMISRALGPVVGATIGVMYWLAITMLSVLECLGAVEALAMAFPAVQFPGYKQAIGSGLMASLALIVWGGINVVTKLGIFFAVVVIFTLFSYYFGLFTVGLHLDSLTGPGSDLITGLSWQTFQANWGPQYDPGVHFGTILSLFYPCFTGILSGANRAEVLQDPPRDIRRGTFAAIIFSLFLYASFFILWGSVASSGYLRGDFETARRLSTEDMSTEAGRQIVQTIVWNPFPKSAFIGIIIASLSQSLQCLIVAPRLLQNMAKDRLLPAMKPLEQLSRGEPVRALLFTYIVAALLVLIGELEVVAPLLTMCFLMAYAFMNCSCLALTWSKSATWRPTWIHRRRWRALNIMCCSLGVVICLSIMIMVHPIWATATCLLALCLYLYMNWRVEVKEWGSAMDGIKFRLALSALVQLEESQHQHVNWRPQVLIIYRISKSRTTQSHEGMLRLSSQLRKGCGFCVVACVLESEERDQEALQKAVAEKQVIKDIMKKEAIEGFAEVVISPSMSEGANYIVQLTGIGGLVPNTVMLDWPEEDLSAGQDFVKVLSHAHSAEKAVLSAKGLSGHIPSEASGTIDVWWMIHDGGFLILLSWLLTQHRTWRGSHIRVFTLAEDVSQEQAKAAGELLTKTLRQRRLFDVEVEVILADDAMIEPYTYDWTLRVEERHRLLSLHAESCGSLPPVLSESIPLEIDDLFNMGSASVSRWEAASPSTNRSSNHAGSVLVTDYREVADGEYRRGRHHCHFSHQAQSDALPTVSQASAAATVVSSADATSPGTLPASEVRATHGANLESCRGLNQIMLSRSSDAKLVVVNLPDPWGTDESSSLEFMTYCNTLTAGLERVLFVHSSGHEIFDITN